MGIRVRRIEGMLWMSDIMRRALTLLESRLKFIAVVHRRRDV